MNTLTNEHIARLKDALSQGQSPQRAISACLGGATAGEGVRRFFSPRHPQSGVERWNEEWCAAWGISNENCFAFGEDIFGNQLLLIANERNVYTCDHENGSCIDLELSLIELLESVAIHGLTWIDFYSNGSIPIAQQYSTRVSWEQHLHWTQPLILGGAISSSNITVVNRFEHLTGHSKLWSQISRSAPGSEIDPQ